MSAIEPRSVGAIARKDFQDAVRSYLFWGLSVFFFLLMALAALTIGWLGDNLDMTTRAFVFLISNVTKLIIPLIALILGWKAIAGERASGSIKVLLSLPHSRMDVVLGKLLGRTGVLAVSLLIGFSIAGIIVGVMMTSFSVAEYGGFLGMTVLYGLAYTAIAVSLSSLTRSTTLAGAAMFGVFTLFYVVWNTIQIGLQFLMFQGYIEGVEYTVDFNGDTLTQERLPDWALFIDTIDPGNAYQNALTVVSSGEGSDIGTNFQAAMFPGDVPFYLQDWFSFIILLVWIVVPVAVALVWFDRVDL